MLYEIIKIVNGKYLLKNGNLTFIIEICYSSIKILFYNNNCYFETANYHSETVIYYSETVICCFSKDNFWFKGNDKQKFYAF